MAETLSDLGILYEELKNYPKAIELLNKSFELSLEIGAKQQQVTASERLMLIYEKMGNTLQAYHFSKMYIAAKESTNNEEKTKAVAEMSARYETEKKQLQIDNLNKERDLQNEIIARKEIESRNQQIIIVSFAVGFVFIAIFLFFLVRLILQKRRANAVLESQKTQIERQNYVLQQAYEEITTQRDTVMNQKELIEVAHTQLTDSLQYALSIQSALLPTEKAFQRFAQSSFIFMLPRDVVSGDFVWTASVGSNHIFCVADCTGHGVPGAFMSVLGISALNEIVVHQHITEPALILEKLRNNVIEALKQNRSDVLHKDGLDIALCTFDENRQELLFSGARIPLWIVMENQNATELPDGTTKITNPENNLVLVNFKPNAMPIGISPKMKPFTQNNLLLKNTNAILYLATDGFADQFGERERKKFQSKNLQQLLLKNAGLPLTEQNQLLRETFSEWRHHAEQIDDVTILGLKL
jgi:serine phosphatase RsbU (regulator of sigma subunit)